MSLPPISRDNKLDTVNFDAAIGKTVATIKTSLGGETHTITMRFNGPVDQAKIESYLKTAAAKEKIEGLVEKYKIFKPAYESKKDFSVQLKEGKNFVQYQTSGGKSKSVEIGSKEAMEKSQEKLNDAAVKGQELNLRAMLLFQAYHRTIPKQEPTVSIPTAAPSTHEHAHARSSTPAEAQPFPIGAEASTVTGPHLSPPTGLATPPPPPPARPSSHPPSSGPPARPPPPTPTVPASTTSIASSMPEPDEAEISAGPQATEQMTPPTFSGRTVEVREETEAPPAKLPFGKISLEEAKRRQSQGREPGEKQPEGPTSEPPPASAGPPSDRPPDLPAFAKPPSDRPPDLPASAKPPSDRPPDLPASAKPPSDRPPDLPASAKPPKDAPPPPPPQRTKSASGGKAAEKVAQEPQTPKAPPKKLPKPPQKPTDLNPDIEVGP